MTLFKQLESLAGASALSTWTEPASGRELPLVTPVDEAHCAEVMRWAAADSLALIPIGGGHHSGYLRAATRVDLAISTSALSKIEAYEPGDGTVTAGAGITIAALREVVQSGGHRLTPDVAEPARRSLGGLLASGQSGFDRLRFGPTRNHVLGMRVLLGDGSQARTGGRLVKNVTGYDLQRLYTGSHGSLCLILEASLRLFPLPECELVCVGSAQTLESARECIASASALPLVWDTLTISNRAGHFRVLAALSGRELLLRSHAHAVERCFAALDQVELTWQAEAIPIRNAAREAERLDGYPSLRLLCKPSQIWQQTDLILEALHELGIDSPSLHLHPQLATCELWLDGLNQDQAADILSELQELVAARQLRVQWFGRDSQVPVDKSAPTSNALRLMGKLQQALDPEAVFARGRFHRSL